MSDPLCQEAFDLIQCSFDDCACIDFENGKRYVRIDCDASCLDIGAVLSQVAEREKMVAFYHPISRCNV